MFSDETWTKTNMAPLRGWGVRGPRLPARVPHGHWKTMTFLAALRHDRIDAPCAVNPCWNELYAGPFNFAMNLKAGRCGLIIDGTAVGKLSCVLELPDDTEAQRFGFLSGPIRQLKRAQTASRVQVDFGHGQIAEIRILQVSDTGIALIAGRFQ